MAPNSRHLTVELRLRGDPPIVDRIRFAVAGYAPVDTGRLQNRRLPNAVAVALAMFRARPRLVLFRIHAAGAENCFVRTILNARNDTVNKSAISGLAVQGLNANESNRFLQLFLGPTSGKLARDYLEIDVARLQPAHVTIKLDGVEISDAEALEAMAEKIAEQQQWDFSGYHFEIRSESALLSGARDVPGAPLAGEEANGKAGGSSFIKVDLSRFSPQLRPLRLNYTALHNVSDLTNKVYLALGEFVEPYHYGHSWVLRDKRLGTVLKNRRILDGLGTGDPVPDPRPLSDAGVIPGTELEAIRLV